jgi:hypothetical protein
MSPLLQTASVPPVTLSRGDFLRGRAGRHGDVLFDDGLDSLPVAYLWPQARAGGDIVEYQLYIGCGFLDGDSDGGDEIYAQITFDDFRTGQRHTANSNVRSGNYQTGRAGTRPPPTCLLWWPAALLAGGGPFHTDP